MRMSRLNLSWTTVVVSLGLGTLLGLAPQERQIVSNEVGVSQREASLQLEFADGGTLSVVFRDGVIRVDGEELGRYESGDDLDAEWRALLGQAIALREDALAEALVAWAQTNAPELVEREEIFTIPAKAADHRRLGAQPSRGHGLIGTFASLVHEEISSQDGLPRLRKAGCLYDHICIRTSYHKNLTLFHGF